MAVKAKAKKTRLQCHRCQGRMTFEKFYGPNDVFFGWRCLICGNIFDPVILLHRVSKDADIDIPETEEKILSLIRKFTPEPKMIPAKNAQRRKSPLRRPEASAAD